MIRFLLSLFVLRHFDLTNHEESVISTGELP